MKIVLVRPPFYSLFGVDTPRMKTYPLNLLYLATYVRDRGGHEAVVVDGDAGSRPKPALPAGSKENPEQIMHRNMAHMVRILENPDHPLWVALEKDILREAPDLIGITCNSANMDAVRILTDRLNRHHIPMVLGGSHPTALPEQSLAYTSARFTAVGEGEATLLGLMDALAAGRGVEKIPSFAWKKNGRFVANFKAHPMESIDDLPVPDRALIHRSDYFGDVLITGRGCSFDCAFCASRTIWGKTVRLRSVPSVVAELEYLYELTALDHGAVQEKRVVKIVDDTFSLNRQRTMALLDEIIGRGLNGFEFTCGVRADTLDRGLLRKMRTANFKRVTLGIESASPAILKRIRKGESPEDMRRGIRLLKEAGIYIHAFFMVGFPGETREDIQMSKAFIMAARPDYVEVNMVTPYPGTELFNQFVTEPPAAVDRWYRWFHQGMSIGSHGAGGHLDRVYEEFLRFAGQYNASGRAS